MKPQFTLVAGLLLVVALFADVRSGTPNEKASSDFETRCGWFDNPTPSNIWLYDREAEWTIGIQGGYQVPGEWPWPNFKSRQWVITNPGGEHGYGCVCMRLRVDKGSHKVLEIQSARGRRLTQCRQDPALKKWSRKFT
jgi:hypothetical protein